MNCHPIMMMLAGYGAGRLVMTIVQLLFQ